MKKLTRKIVALTLSLVMCISFSNTTFAYADNENISSSAEASKVNWWKIGWIILYRRGRVADNFLQRALFSML